MCLHLVLGDPRVLGGRVAQGLPFLQEGLSSPVWEAREGSIEHRPLKEGAPEIWTYARAHSTHRGACSANEAYGTLRGTGKGRALAGALYPSF